ncbi:MAG: hypothetical protein NT121_25510, partial [Chloroflexi bacterium]|nr:hypothetical protein [Chloroflexota bacterium]
SPFIHQNHTSILCYSHAIAVELPVTEQTPHIIQMLLLDKSRRPKGIAALMRYWRTGLFRDTRIRNRYYARPGTKAILTSFGRLTMCGFTTPSWAKSCLKFTTGTATRANLSLHHSLT